MRWIVTGGATVLRPAAARAAEAAVARGLDPATCDEVELAVHELLANALEHGHLGDGSRPIDLEVARGDGSVTVAVTDRAVGGPWAPVDLAAPTDDGYDDPPPTRGRGLRLVAALVGPPLLVAVDGGTRVELVLPTDARTASSPQEH